MNDYIISYGGGSGGRFINAIFLYIANSINESIAITKENSGHNTPDNPDTTYGLPQFYNYDPDMFSKFGWDRTKFEYCTLQCHQKPKFEHIRLNPNLTNTKVVFIQVEENDFLETMSNLAYKAYISKVEEYQSLGDKDKDHYVKNSGRFFREVTISLFQKHQLSIRTLDTSSPDIIVKIRDLIINNTKQGEFFKNFLSIDIPDDFIDRTLVLKFKDLKSEKGLEKIKQFTNNDLSLLPNVERSYMSYIQGQKTLILEKMPWLLP